MSRVNYREFVRESNRIEGIHREPTEAEIKRLQNFVLLPKLEVDDVVDFVKFTQPNAVLRDNISVHGVRIGEHIAPPSGPEIRFYLGEILGQMQMGTLSTYDAHCAYLNLHPFTDGNGRSARAIWLWNMNGIAPLGFLHTFYYQTLANQDVRKAQKSS
jgi:hypothetical protein